MSAVFHREPRLIPPTAVRGDGAYLIDAAGKRYLDASGGAAVSCLGHTDPDVRAAMTNQVERLAFAHTAFFTNEPQEHLAETLVADAPGTLSRCWFVSGGSEAIEAALKLARQYHVESGQPQRVNLIARRQSYHGNTLGALAVGGNAWRRHPFEPLLIGVSHVSPCYVYRGLAAGEDDQAYAARLADELEAEILRLGADTVMAFVAEPVVGATLGAVPAVATYFRRIREVCDRYGVLLIFDEVMCGMGRTGTYFACEADAVAPDLLCLAKGLAAGYQPIGAVLVSTAIYQTIVNGSGSFQHGHTFMGHALACAAALAVQRKIRAGDLLARVRQLGGALEGRLRDRFGAHPHVGDIRGRGLFWALEFVADRGTKRAFDPTRRLHAQLKRAAMDRGLICYPMGGTVDGRSGDHVLLAPPYIVDEDQIDELTGLLALAVEDALANV